MPDRAQSEALGFILVFAIIVSTVGIVYVSGFSGLTDVRDVERVNNAQRAFEVLADNVADINERGAPSRATEIKLADANLLVDDPIEIEVNVVGEYSGTYRVRPVVFDADTGSQVVFVQGAVIRQDGGSGIVAHESALLFNESRTVVPIIRTRLDGRGSIGGSGTVLVRADHSNTVIDYSSVDGPHTVWFNVTSPRAATWHRYLAGKDDIGENDCTLVDNTVSCTFETERIYITDVKIDVSIE